MKGTLRHGAPERIAVAPQGLSIQVDSRLKTYGRCDRVTDGKASLHAIVARDCMPRDCLAARPGPTATYTAAKAMTEQLFFSNVVKFLFWKSHATKLVR